MKSDRVESSVVKFQSGSSCAQAVLSTYLPLLGISESTAHRMGAGLGGGIGSKQYVCGALNAAVIVLSTHSGNETADDSDQKDITVERVRQFVEEFEQKFGSAQCYDLLGYDVNNEDDPELSVRVDISRTVCDPCVEFVCQYLEKTVIQDNT